MLQERILVQSSSILLSINDDIVMGCKNGWINVTVRTGRGIGILVFFSPFSEEKNNLAFFSVFFFILKNRGKKERSSSQTFKEVRKKSITTSHCVESLYSKVQIKRYIVKYKTRKKLSKKLAMQGDVTCFLCQQTQNTLSDIN